MKLEKDLHAYLWQNSYENNCNTYVIEGEHTVLIDPGHSHHLEELWHEMEKDGIPPEKISLVIVTHSHPDHFEGLEVFLNQSTKIATNQDEERYFLQSGKTLFEMMRWPLPTYRIDFYLKDGGLLLGKDLFHICKTPGHSPGSISIYWPGRRDRICSSIREPLVLSKLAHYTDKQFNYLFSSWLF